jgi:hypothetical protein
MANEFSLFRIRNDLVSLADELKFDKWSTSTDSNGCQVTVKMTFSKSFSLTVNDFASFKTGENLEQAPIDVYFAMSNERSQSSKENCLFFTCSFTRSIFLGSDLPKLQQDIFLKRRLFFPLQLSLEKSWLLCSANMQNESLEFYGLVTSNQVDLNRWSQSILDWFVFSFRSSEVFDSTRWKIVDKIITCTSPTTVHDSGVFMLMCADNLAILNCGIPYDHIEVETHRRTVKLDIFGRAFCSEDIVSNNKRQKLDHEQVQLSTPPDIESESAVKKSDAAVLLLGLSKKN